MYEMALVTSSAPIEDEPCVVIPAQFLRSWKQWLFRPAEVQRPQGIDNTRFICRHGDLIVDPNVTGDLDGEMAFVRRRDYDVLEDLYVAHLTMCQAIYSLSLRYPSGPLISVESNGDTITHALSVCAECRTER